MFFFICFCITKMFAYHQNDPILPKCFYITKNMNFLKHIWIQVRFFFEDLDNMKVHQFGSADRNITIKDFCKINQVGSANTTAKIALVSNVKIKNTSRIRKREYQIFYLYHIKCFNFNFVF